MHTLASPPTMAYPPEPTFDAETRPIYIPKLRAFMTVGDFVIVSDLENESPAIWRIIMSTDDGDFVANQFTVIDFNRHRFAANSPLAHRGSITHESVRYIPEVVQTENQKRLPSKSVDDVAFVYKEEEITDGTIPSCQGMTNVYVIRFRDDGYALGPTECLSFPSDYRAFSDWNCFCYSNHISLFIRKAFKAMTTVIGRSAERAQGIRTKKRVCIESDSLC